MPKLKLTCKGCGAGFERFPSQVRSGYCSTRCGYAHRRSPSEAHRQAISRALKGRPSNNPGRKDTAEPVTCSGCGCTFDAPRWRRDRAKKGIFCTHACYAEWRSREIVGPAHPNYRDELTYNSAHQWAAHHLERPACCEFCGLRAAGDRETLRASLPVGAAPR